MHRAATLIGLTLAAGLLLAASTGCSGGGGGGGPTKTVLPRTVTTGTPVPTVSGQATAVTTAARETGAPPANPSPTRQAGAGQPTVSLEDAAAVAAAVDQVFAAIQQSDYERMRTLSDPSLRGDVTNRELDSVFRCFAGSVRTQPAAPQIRLSGNTARVTVTFQGTGATPRTVAADEPWEFARQQDGAWLLRRLPPCPAGGSG